MPTLTISFCNEDYERLQTEFQTRSDELLQPGLLTDSHRFESWLSQRMISANPSITSNAELDHIRIFNTIEKLITNMHQHGFNLAYVGKPEGISTHSIAAFAEAIVADLKLPMHYTKRFQDLVTHYQKNAKEITETAQIGITSRAYRALNDAYRNLFERTEKSIDHLGSERAIGRVEGAAALLVNIEMMDRMEAKKKTDTFKLNARSPQRAASWVGKVLGTGMP